MRLSAQELYELRRALLAAEQKGLEARLAQNKAKAILLEMELKYGLLATEGKLDINTGQIEEGLNEPGADEDQGATGPQG